MVQAHSVCVSLICPTKSCDIGLSIPHLLLLLIKLSKSHLPPCGSLICLPLTTSFLFQNLVLELCPYDVHGSPAATSNRSIVLKHCVWNESWPHYRHFLHFIVFSFQSWWPLEVLKSLSYWDRCLSNPQLLTSTFLVMHTLPRVRPKALENNCVVKCVICWRRSEKLNIAWMFVLPVSHVVS